jgi:hypothetical protein
MNQEEEKLQQAMEQKQQSINNLDQKAYHLVFRSLSLIPGADVSPGFAAAVVVKIEKQKRKAALQELAWMIFAGFLLLISLAVAIVLSGFRIDMGFLKGLGSYSGVVVFGLFFVLLLHFVDKRLLRKKVLIS